MYNEIRKLRIVLADDHPILRSGLKNLIHENPTMTVVAEAENGAAVLDILREKSCDMLILDLSMPKVSGLEILETIRGSYPDLKVLVLSMHKEPEFVQKAFAKKVHGYLLKDEAFDKLISAIKTIAAGHKSFSRDLLSVAMDSRHVLRESHISFDLLTQREREILVLLARGWNNGTIAEELGISARTVEAHRARVMAKLQFEDIAGLVRYAADKGLI
ncbi:MAG: response regulator transcription factor [Spirochaetes bacterium]|nr:response regulator transcription factor [Spirochaetota bacterium]